MVGGGVRGRRTEKARPGRGRVLLSDVDTYRTGKGLLHEVVAREAAAANQQGWTA